MLDIAEDRYKGVTPYGSSAAVTGSYNAIGILRHCATEYRHCNDSDCHIVMNVVQYKSVQLVNSKL